MLLDRVLVGGEEYCGIDESARVFHILVTTFSLVVQISESPFGKDLRMARRTKPILVATRVTEEERALIDMAARIAGLTITELLRRIILPEIRAQLLGILDRPQDQLDAPTR